MKIRIFKTITAIALIATLGFFAFSNPHAGTLEAKFKLEKVTLISGGHTLGYYKEQHPEQIDSAMEEVNKRINFGEKIEFLNNGSTFKFIYKTISSYYNDGYECMEFETVRKHEKTQKYQFGLGGTNDRQLAVNHKSGFKGSLNDKLGIDYKRSTEINQKEEVKFKTKIEPGTKLIYSITGQGGYYCGTASRYFFRVRQESGTFEYLDIHHLRNTMTKLRIRY